MDVGSFPFSDMDSSMCVQPLYIDGFRLMSRTAVSMAAHHIVSVRREDFFARLENFWSCVSFCFKFTIQYWDSAQGSQTLIGNWHARLPNSNCPIHLATRLASTRALSS
jgi:hypothetical protein